MPHDPVMITSDDSWISQSWPGDGTSGNPYIISSIWISDASVWGIWISNTSACFVISDCQIDGEFNEGIHISNCLNATIERTAVSNQNSGITIEDTSYASIENCTISSHHSGLILDGVGIITITASQITGRLRFGCEIYSSLVLLDGNTITNSETGIYSESLTAGQFYNNTFTNCNAYGLILGSQSTSCIIMDNIFIGDRTGGLHLQRTTTMVVLENTFIHCGLSVNGTLDTHFFHVVVNNTVNGKPLAYNIGLENEEFSADDYGQMYFADCQNVSVVGGSITDTQYAVSIHYSSGCRIDQVTCTDCQIGVRFDRANHTIIQNSVIRDCTIGILWLSGFNSSMILNTISHSESYGLFMEGTYYSRILNNTFFQNQYGLRDDGLENMWDDGVSFGNIYDDYNGTGFYYIPGSADSIDHYPRKYVGNLPIMDELFVYILVSVLGVVVLIAFIFLRRRNKR